MGRRGDHYRPPPFPWRPTLVLPVPTDPTGEDGPTPKQARGPRWRQTSRGLFVPAATPVTSQQRTLEASRLIRADGAVTGWAALDWGGARWCDGVARDGELVPVPLVVPGAGLRSQTGYLISRERLPPTDVVVLDGLRVTSAVRAACFEARRARDVRSAVRWFDLPATWDLFSLAEVASHLAALRGQRGYRQAAAALGLAVENCWSPAEVDMRMIWVIDLGITGLLCNQPIFDLDGNHIGTPDLFDPVAGVAGEYDSELHWLDRAKDLKREGRFRRVGLEYVAMVGVDRADPTDFRQRTRDAYARAAHRAGSRQWTLQGPPWWRYTQTVAQRRALSAWERDRWLRWQAA